MIRSKQPETQVAAESTTQKDRLIGQIALGLEMSSQLSLKIEFKLDGEHRSLARSHQTARNSPSTLGIPTGAAVRSAATLQTFH